MKYRKIILFTILSLVLASCSTLHFMGSDSMDNQPSLEARARRDRRHFPRIVSTLPDGFIALDIATKDMDGILSIYFWHTTFGFQDSEGMTIFNTDVHDDSFIVIYRNQYYICENQFSQILDDAMNIFEQLNRMYSVGEAMEMRGAYNNGVSTYTITITSVERHEKATVAVYEINFSVFPSVDSRDIIGFFEAAVLQSGDRSDEFVLINDEKVTIELDSTEFLDTLVLNIPRGLRVFTSQNNTRIVNLHKD